MQTFLNQDIFFFEAQRIFSLAVPNLSFFVCSGVVRTQLHAGSDRAWFRRGHLEEKPGQVFSVQRLPGSQSPD